MRKALLMFLLFAAGAHADESDSNFAGRVQMLDVAPANFTMAAAVQSAAEAASEENLAAFLNCFTPSAKRRLRDKMAMTFLQHSVSMTVIDTHVLAETKTRGEIAVKYDVTLSETRYTCISRVELAKEPDGWKINHEKVVIANTAAPQRRCFPCAGGRCRL